MINGIAFTIGGALVSPGSHSRTAQPTSSQVLHVVVPPHAMPLGRHLWAHPIDLRLSFLLHVCH